MLSGAQALPQMAQIALMILPFYAYFTGYQKLQGMTAAGASVGVKLRSVLRSLLPGAEEIQAASTVEKTEFNGHACYRVKMTITSTGDEYHDYYDVKTGLLAGRDDLFHGPAGAVGVYGEASDYQRFGNLTIATRWKHKAGGQEWEAVYTSFEANSVENSAFQLPAELVAEASQ